MEIYKNATQKKINSNSEKIIQEIITKKLEKEVESVSNNSVLSFQELGTIMSKLNFFKYIFNDKYKIYSNERGEIQNKNEICKEYLESAEGEV